MFKSATISAKKQSIAIAIPCTVIIALDH